MLLLFSASPRRKTILTDLGLEFTQIPADISEDQKDEENYLEYLERITHSKAIAGIEIFTKQYPGIGNFLGIASDTIVVLGNTVLHKPVDYKEAKETLLSLTCKVHNVYSSITLWRREDGKDEVIFDWDKTELEFKDWNGEDIDFYIKKCNPYDKAGSYGIQDSPSPIRSWRGSYTNVMGFSLRKFFLYKSLWENYVFKQQCPKAYPE